MNHSIVDLKFNIPLYYKSIKTTEFKWSISLQKSNKTYIIKKRQVIFRILVLLILFLACTLLVEISILVLLCITELPISRKYIRKFTYKYVLYETKWIRFILLPPLSGTDSHRCRNKPITFLVMNGCWCKGEMQTFI